MLQDEYPDLVESVAKGNCVLFLGAHCTLGDSGPPLRADLVQALAGRYSWIASDVSLYRACEQYLVERPNGRNTLIQFIRTQLASSKLTPVHKTIVEFDFAAVVTAWYDSLLERAFREKGKQPACIISGSDAAYANLEEDVLIIKLYGDIDNAKSLVLTHRDLLRMEGALDQKLADTAHFIRLRPVIFVGWNPSDDHLKKLYFEATKPLGKHKRHSYIVWPTPTLEDQAWWAQENAEVISTSPRLFFQALRAAVQQQQSTTGYSDKRKVEQLVGKLPYKFLDYFDPEDNDIFYGRNVETERVYRMTLTCPLLTLFGESGVGKTSLLRAGVIPELQREGYDYAYVRAFGNPLQSIREVVSNKLGYDAHLGTTLVDFFRHVLGRDGRMVVFLDQFEELFTRAVDIGTRTRFWNELGQCSTISWPELHFVISIREDYLAELDEARHPSDSDNMAPIPSILRNSYRLTQMDPDAARLAIEEPAKRANCNVEPLLIDVLLGQTKMPGEDGDTSDSGRWSVAEMDGKIPLPALQIVMDYLYRSALAQTGMLPPAELTDTDWHPPHLHLTLERYRDIGDAATILSEYISDALKQVADRGGNRPIAKAILKALVTSKKTTTSLVEDDLVTEVSRMILDYDPDADTQMLSTTLNILKDLRLIRSFHKRDEILYELAHEHMVQEITTWITEDELQIKRIQELLEREYASWRSLGKLIDPAALKLIDQKRDALRILSADRQELLLRSALTAGHDVQYWLDRTRDPQSKLTILTEHTDSESPELRGRALYACRELALSEPKLAQRVANLLIKALADKDDNISQWAVYLLAEVAYHNKNIVVAAELNALLDAEQPTTRERSLDALKLISTQRPSIVSDRLLAKAVELFQDEDEQVRIEAMEAARYFAQNDPVTSIELAKTLIDLLDDKHYKVRAKAIYNFVELGMGDKELIADTLPVIIESMRDTQKLVRVDAAEGLRYIVENKPSFAAQVVSGLVDLQGQDAPGYVHSDISEALERIVQEHPEVATEAASQASDLLASNSIKVRTRMVLDLGRIGAVTSEAARYTIPELTRALQDEAKLVRNKSKETLKRLIERFPKLKPDVTATLRQLLEAEELEDNAIRNHIAETLYTLGDDAA